MLPQATPTAPADPPHSTPAHETIASLRAALAEAGLAIASFRWRLREAGYPFAEPPNLNATITQIDAALFPEAAKPETKKQARRVCQTAD
jgi:hypothetical protein